MRIDTTTYQIATRVTLLGFVLHLISALTVLIFGLQVQDDVTEAAGYYMLLGLPIWVVLALLFYQHKMERVEAIEAEKLAEQVQRGTTIFEGEEDLNVAARRLRWMYRYLEPAVSALLALGLIGLGVWLQGVFETKRTLPGFTQASQDQLLTASGNEAAWGLAITGVIAAVMFIFSRYIAGMSKQPAWQNLRGGASAAVGVALVSAVLAIGHGFIVAGNGEAMRVLTWILPIFVILVGIEIGVNFILNLYRPRRPGQFPRPAFDSRILSLLAAPDTVVQSISDAINYQFGFEVTSTWFYQLLSRLVVPLVAFVVLLLVAINCVAVVRPNEQAILLSFGRLARDGRVFESGPILKWPWQTVARYDVHRVRQVVVGRSDDVTERDETSPILWGKAHTTANEDLIIVAPTRVEDRGGRSNPVASHFSLLNAEIPVQYRIKSGPAGDIDGDGQPDPGLLNYVMFVGGDRAHENLIRAMATRVVTRYAAARRIDELLGPERGGLSNALRQELQRELDAANAGVEVVFVGIAGVHPPVSVAESFEEVLKAREEREAAIQRAEAEAIEALASVAGDVERGRAIAGAIAQLDELEPDDPAYDDQLARVEELLLETGGQASRTLLAARAERWSRQMNALAQMVRHNSRLEPYLAAPSLYREREYLERVSAILGRTDGRLRVVIAPAGSKLQSTIQLVEDATTLDLQSAIEGNEARYQNND